MWGGILLHGSVFTQILPWQNSFWAQTNLQQKRHVLVVLCLHNAKIASSIVTLRWQAFCCVFFHCIHLIKKHFIGTQHWVIDIFAVSGWQHCYHCLHDNHKNNNINNLLLGWNKRVSLEEMGLLKCINTQTHTHTHLEWTVSFSPKRSAQSSIQMGFSWHYWSSSTTPGHSAGHCRHQQGELLPSLW